MKNYSLYLGILMVLIGILPPAAQAAGSGSDLRSDNQALARQRRLLIQKADAEKQEAQKKARTQTIAIANNKQTLEKAVADLGNNIKAMKAENKKIHGTIARLKIEEKMLDADLEKSQEVNQEFSGFVRSHAKNPFTPESAVRTSPGAP